MWKLLRKDLLLVLAVTAVFLSLSYAVGSVFEPSLSAVEAQPAFLGGERAPRAQAAAGRVWREPAFERLRTLGPDAISQPAVLRVGDADGIYVLDWADLRIKAFSPDGNLQRVVGEGRGKGTGAFINPTSFSVGPAGELWVCDPRQQRITHFTSDGKAQAVTPQSAVDRIAAVADVLFTKAPPGLGDLFEVYSLSGQQLKSFGEILEDQYDQGIILDGDIVGDAGSKGFIYGGRYVGVLAAYGADGEQRFVVRTIDGPPPPKELHVGANRKVKPNSTQAVLSMSLRGNELYVLSGTRDDGPGGSGGQVMDVYDKRDGSYLFSLKLPITCSQAVVGADYAYTVSKEGVTVWRFRQGELRRG